MVLVGYFLSGILTNKGVHKDVGGRVKGQETTWDFMNINSLQARRSTICWRKWNPLGSNLHPSPGPG